MTLLNQAANETQIITTKHGKSIAKPASMACVTDQKNRQQIIEHLKKARKHNNLNALDLKNLINKGRC